jgi:quinohemoprotein ethanol dehydrogenase
VRAAAKQKKIDGYLVAWDPVKQKEAWRVRYGKGGNGGTLTTAGNLVVEGTSHQQLVIYRATDGKQLWATDAQTVPMAGPITYTVGGEQYIAVEAGGASFGPAQGDPDNRSMARVLAFKLGADAHLPSIPPRPKYPPPPFVVGGTEEEIRAGSIAYHRVCAQCHGRDAISTNAIPDLRHMTPDTRAQFNQIVLKGLRASKGMASFSDLLSDKDAEAIYAYLVARAREDWNQ